MTLVRNSSAWERFYKIYRKIRYLCRRGSLFSMMPATQTQGLSDYPKGSNFIISINSLVLFLLGYLIVYLVYLFATAFSANASDIPLIINYNDINFLIQGNEWTSDTVTAVFSAGPLISFILAISMLILYSKVAMETGILRLLVVWILFHSLTRFFGEILVGALMTRGLGYVILYMFIMDTGKLVITFFAIVAMFTIGLLLTRLVLYTGSTYFTDLIGKNRVRLIWNQFIIPFFIGNIMIFLIKLPEISLFDIALNACMILILLPITMRSFSIGDLYFDDDPRQIKFVVYFAIATIALLVLFRVIFGIGVRIG